MSIQKNETAEVYDTTHQDNEATAQKKHEKSENVTYDQFIQSAGEFGKYQLFLFFCTFPFYVFGVFSYLSQVFLTEVSPQHWCWIPELQNLTSIQRRDLAIPLDPNSPYGYSRCEVFEANWTAVLHSGVEVNQSWNKIPCQHGWEFNKTEFSYSTISSEFGWVCERDSYQAIAQSLFFVGSIIGGFLVGWIADRFGRLPATIFSNILGCIAGTASAFTQNFIQFVICRFIMGMSYDNCMMMTYLIVLEYTSPKYRTMISNLSFATFFTAAAVALPWISLACGYWRTVALATSLPMALSILAPFVIPESPRWLLSRGRVDDTIIKVSRIAEVNKKVIPQDTITNFKKSVLINEQQSGNLLELISRPLLRKVFICICIEYMCCLIVFDSLIRTIGQLKFDYFVSFSVISFTEFPSLVIISFALDFIGRKFMLIMVMTLSALFSLMIPFVPAGLPSVICAVVARFCVNMACNTAVLWTAELLPTSVRGSGSSIVHICGYIATVISPFIAYLDTYIYWLPMIVVGCVAILGALIGLIPPETARKDMPQTFENAEELIKSQGLLEIPFMQKKKVGTNLHCFANESFEFN